MSTLTTSPAVCRLCGETFVQITRLRLNGMSEDKATVTVTDYPHRPCPAIPDPISLVVSAGAADLKRGMTLAELREIVDQCDMADGMVRVLVNMRGGIKKVTVEET